MENTQHQPTDVADWETTDWPNDYQAQLRSEGTRLCVGFATLNVAERETLPPVASLTAAAVDPALWR